MDVGKKWACIKLNSRHLDVGSQGSERGRRQKAGYWERTGIVEREGEGTARIDIAFFI